MATHEEIMARYAILQNRPNLDLDSSDSEDDGATLEVLQRKYDANGDFGGDDAESDPPAAVDATITPADVTAPVPSQAAAPRSGLARKLQDMYGDESSDGESSDGESSDSEDIPGGAANGSAQPTKHLFSRSSFGSGLEDRREPGSVSSAPAGGSSKDTWTETLQEKWAPMTLEEVRVASAEFAIARDWTQFHRPRNVMAALTSEIGEVRGESLPFAAVLPQATPRVLMPLCWLIPLTGLLVLSCFLPCVPLQLTEGIGLWREVGFGGEGLTTKGTYTAEPPDRALL